MARTVSIRMLTRMMSGRAAVFGRVFANENGFGDSPKIGPQRIIYLSKSRRLAALGMLLLQMWISTPLHLLAGESINLGITIAASSLNKPAGQQTNERTAEVTSIPFGCPLTEDPSEEQLFMSGLFSEPLIPVGRHPTPEENRELAAALRKYAAGNALENVDPLSAYLEANSNSPWRMSLLVNLGILHSHAARFSRTFACWEEAWNLGREATDSDVKALADRAVAELIRMNARVGRIDQLESLFQAIAGRQVTGAASEIIASARRGLWRMKNEPWYSFRCGPLALDRLMAFQNSHYTMPGPIFDARSTTNGFSLLQVWELSKKVGLSLQPAKRSSGAKVMVPAVIHWKTGHYAALVKEEPGGFRLQDSTFGRDFWMSKETLDEEASGYFLVASGALPVGWSGVDRNEAATVFGKGDATNQDANGPTWYDLQQPVSYCPRGMPAYSAKLFSVSLHLQDVPIGYRPPRGPAIDFIMDYNHREQHQPAVFVTSNFGPKWTFNWMSYVSEIFGYPSSDVSVYLPGGGQVVFTGFNGVENSSAPETRSGAVLTRNSSSSYTLVFPDGSKYVFGRSAGSGLERRTYLTQSIDPAGNAVNVIYDSRNRISGLRDGIGQLTTLNYGPISNSLKISKITDPFGRSASFDYDSLGRLSSITDVAGMRSEFRYQEGTDFIETMTTPYGISRFRHGDDGTSVWLEMTDPEGATERIEYRNQAPGLSFSDTVGVPQGIQQPFNQYIWSRNTFYWDKQAFRMAAGDYTKARIYHWLHDANPRVAIGILESQKEPLENRVWRNYPGQVSAGSFNSGMQSQPSRLARLLGDGSTELYQYEYNPIGKVTKMIDPVGRTTTYVYDSNQIDLLEIRQTARGNDLLEVRTYNNQHLPVMVADGSGRTNRFTYNGSGQVLTATSPLNEVTSFEYDSNGYLVSVDGPETGTNDITRFSYDRVGNVRSVTDAEGYTLTYSYDALDRLTRIVFPDGTFEENTFDRLDRSSFRDRLGRITRFFYDANRHLTGVEDPLHRTTSYNWCSCGQLIGLVDPMGRTTRWHRDIQGRITEKEYVDGSKQRYSYEAATGRLTSVTDEKDQTKTYEYWLDGSLRKIGYQSPEHPTPSVSFVYDQAYNRVVSMEDGSGLTTYSYYSANTNGGALASIDGPLQDDTIVFHYDELGRVSSRSINRTVESYTFDALGRLRTITNVLGRFSYLYTNASTRPIAVVYPNGQRTDYRYMDNLGDRRIREIEHHYIPSTVTTKLAYGYDSVGQITRWVKQFDNRPSEIHAFTYDEANELLSSTVSIEGVVTRTNAYKYDPAGNRLIEKNDSNQRTFAYNALNQITSFPDDLEFSSSSFEWDAENRLIAIVQGQRRSEFSYDGLGRRIRIQEKEGGTTISDRRYLWCGNSVCEERDPSSPIVKKRFFSQGETTDNELLFYARDHLDSVCDISDVSGLRIAQFEFSDFGERKLISGKDGASLGFTGHYFHGASGLYLTRYRPYSAALGRWLTRDPLPGAELLPEGANLYVYVQNNPVNFTDPLGLSGCRPTKDLTKKNGPDGPLPKTPIVFENTLPEVIKKRFRNASEGNAYFGSNRNGRVAADAIDTN